MNKMQAVIDFLVNNYFWFLILSLIFIFAFIGYLIDQKKSENEVVNEEMNSDMPRITSNVENKSLNNMINDNNANVITNVETNNIYNNNGDITFNAVSK